ncbi:prepilin-type N-terminal cleavage/methylation domain-containing protein [Cryobacterium sp. LW097]|uniref:type IV pilus modification PilV family protein n=1 Tax=Cryobacterium sp. LW097 TaxID=1978566 RepID=UPI0012473BC1|nr:type II secretion system protein [Cryobacterium sp. LW097]
MTLIEVIVAISLIGIVATAAISLSITSQKGASVQQRQEIAVTIATEAMERVSAQSAATNPTTSTSYLYDGRTQAKVDLAWTANTGVSGLAATYKGWDTEAVAASVPVLPISQVVDRAGTDYTVYTLLGTCYMATTGGDCKKLAASTPPATPPSGQTPLNRAIVVVRWNAGSGCAASGCSYLVSSLIDAHSDLQWNAP